MKEKIGNEDQKQEALISLYHETWSEVNRLRDFEWKIAYYFVSLTGGLIILIANDTLRLFLTFFLKWVLTIFQFIAIFFSIYYLDKTHSDLTQQRNIRREIEEVLRFYDRGIYKKNSILPEKWKGVRITKKFERLGLLVPIVVTVILFQLFGIYIIWKI